MIKLIESMYNRAQTHDPGHEYLSLLYNHTSCIRICLERFYLTLFAASVTNPITIFARLLNLFFFLNFIYLSR